jgi:large subunit ribosomal protein L13
LPKSQKPQPQKAQNKPEIVTQEFDASGKILGRLASEIASVLRGKNKPSFRPNLVVGDKVLVKNAAKIMVTGNKLEQKMYYHHTGYLGNLKAKKLKDIMGKNPGEALERAVYGMLPKNKLRDIWMKNLKIEN